MRLSSRRLLPILLLCAVAPCGSAQSKGQKDKTSSAKPAGTAGNAPLTLKPGEKLNGAAGSDGEVPDSRDAAKKPDSVYSFGLPTADGKNLSLADFKGKALLIVNLARESSYASQLSSLQKLSETFKDKGLVVIGVPSNDFGKAEPGTAASVAQFYTDAKLTFPVMQLSTLTGVHELPLFTFLASSKAVENAGLHWNYTKFLIDRKGKPVVCFPPDVAPDSLDLVAAVQEVLDGSWKPKKPKRPAGGNDEDEGF